MSLVGQTISHYKVLEKLGEGGMGEVYKGEDTKLNRTVALKFLSSQTLNAPEAKTRFITEARAAAALDHPNICSVHEIDEVDDHMFIAMQYVDGESLTEKIKRGPLKLQEILTLGIDITRGLQEAHEKNIVHRDIKSANVMVTGKGQGKITDFGLAKLVGSTRVTKTGTMLGTAAYMSPEQVAGETVDHRSDIWSLGVILYEMVTGRLPFEGHHEQAIAYQIVNEEAEPITAVRSGIPMELERIVSKCLEKNASDRYQHVDDVQVDLRNVNKTPGVTKYRKSSLKYLLPASVFVLAIVLYMVLKPLFSPDTQMTFENPLAGAVFTKVTDIEGSDAAISPDGKFVAFVSDHDGQFDIWVSIVGTGNVYNRTRGTAGDVRRGLQPVGFSANSSQIFLIASPHHKFQSMPLFDGPGRSILRDSVIQANWSPDGSRVAYFMSAPGDPVFVANEDGTNSRKILDSEPGMHQHFPTWSPDGKWLYIVRGYQNIGETDLWRVRPDGKQLEQLTEYQRDVTHPAPIDDRIVLFVARNENGAGPWLWAVDLETKVSQRVSIGLERYRSLSTNHNGNRLAAAVTTPAEARLWSVPILERVATEADANLYDLPTQRAKSPRFCGETLYFLSSRGGGDGLWKYSDGQLMEVWNDANSALIETPAVSADGKSVAIVLWREGNRRIYVLWSDGSNLRLLSESVDVRGTGSWSSDGKWIVIGGTDSAGQGLFKISIDGGGAERIVDGEALNPIWSPKRDLIIYTGPQVAGFSALLAVRPDGTPIEFPDIRVRFDGERYRFLPDGSGLVYMEGRIAFQDFWLLDLSTMKSRQLTDIAKGASIRTFDITPDGSTIVFDRQRENSAIILIELADDKINE